MIISPRILIIAALSAVLVVAIIIGVTISNRRAEDAREAGAAVQREENLNQTITNAERAKNAAETIKRDPAARDAECLMYSRNPEDC